MKSCADHARWLVEQQSAAARSLVSRANQVLLACVAVFGFLFVAPGIVARLAPDTVPEWVVLVVVCVMLVVTAAVAFLALRVTMQRPTRVCPLDALIPGSSGRR